MAVFAPSETETSNMNLAFLRPVGADHVGCGEEASLSATNGPPVCNQV
jgi:hypothetical protein